MAAALRSTASPRAGLAASVGSIRARSSVPSLLPSASGGAVASSRTAPAASLSPPSFGKKTTGPTPLDNGARSLGGSGSGATGRASRGSGASGHGSSQNYSVVASASAGGSFAGNSYREPLKICILGGGFGGLYTAVKLDQLMWPEGTKPQVTLIDQNDRFVFKPMLYELLNDSVQPWEVAPRFDKLLQQYAVRFVQGQVASVQPADSSSEASGGRVVLKDGMPVEYDYLVLALGADATPRGIPGAKDFAIPFVTFDDAMKVRSHLEVLEKGSNTNVTIVGAGYAGVELAVAVAERLGITGSVRLVTPGQDILSGATPGLRQSATKTLSKLGVSVMTDTRVVGIEPGEAASSKALTPRIVKLSRGGSKKQVVLDADLVLWTGGNIPLTNDNEETFRAKPRFGMPFPLNDRGATETEPTLRVINNTRVFALGDVSSIHYDDLSGMDEHLPQTAQVAFQQADYVAWNLWASINSRPLLPFRYQHLGSMMSMGKTAGSVAVPLPLPPPITTAFGSGQLGQLLGAVGVQVNDSGVTLEGPLGGLARRAAYWYRQPTDDHRARVGVSWLGQAAKEAADMAGTAGISSLLGALQNANNKKQ